MKFTKVQISEYIRRHGYLPMDLKFLETLELSETVQDPCFKCDRGPQCPQEYFNCMACNK